MDRKKHIFELIIAVIGVYAAIFMIVMFNRHLLMGFLLPARMVIMIAVQWLIFLIPGILMLIKKERFADLGFSNEAVLRQILLGVVLAFAMSAVLTVVPILFGLEDMVTSTSYTKPWQFIYQFAFAITGVALAEELVFRGYIYYKLLRIMDNKWFAIGISSALFGLLHIFGGSLLQVIMTALIGLLYCVARDKIKGLTTLSLILAHGIYDALIVLWAAVL